MEDHELQGLFRFATGEGQWAQTGPYMHTHQGGEIDAVHEGCVELERRGLLKRHIDEPGHVCWVRAGYAPLNAGVSRGESDDATYPRYGYEDYCNA